jgi:hypothetical protein
LNNLGPTDFHLFEPLKWHLLGQGFVDDDDDDDDDGGGVGGGGVGDDDHDVTAAVTNYYRLFTSISLQRASMHWFPALQ